LAWSGPVIAATESLPPGGAASSRHPGFTTTARPAGVRLRRMSRDLPSSPPWPAIWRGSRGARWCGRRAAWARTRTRKGWSFCTADCPIASSTDRCRRFSATNSWPGCASLSGSGTAATRKRPFGPICAA